MKISRSGVVRAIEGILLTLVMVLAAARPSLRANDGQQVPINSGDSKGNSAGFAAQADRGKEAYQQSCSGCHQSDLSGIDMAPSLAGSDFINRWEGKTGKDFFDRTSMTMPADRPGALSSQNYLDLLAYVLQANSLPQPSEVTKETLDGITFH